MNIKELPLITVITVVYNNVKHIEETIQSVINQTYSNIEYIIIDGGSTDGTVDVIKKYADRIVYWVSEPDKGIYDAMNKGICKATGAWIGIMNSGDTFHSKTVLYDVFGVNDFSYYDIIYGNAIEISFDSNKLVKSDICSSKRNIPPAYRHGASFVRGSVHKQYLFDLSQEKMYGYALDYDCICSLYRAGFRFKYVDVIIVDYDKDGISNHPLKNKYIRALIENGGNNDVKFYFRLLRSMLFAIIKKFRHIFI